MPRAVWSGAISFGLVSIPVKLFTAVSSKTVRFNQIDRRTGSRVRQRLVSEADGSEVERSDITKGYQIRPGDFVLIDDDELEALMPKAEHTIDIEEFVDLADIDPIYFDRPYWLAPDPATVKPYALLAATMAESEKVAIARFVMRSRQQLAAIRSVDGRLVMSTMNWDDELVVPDELPGFDVLAEVEVSDREMGLAEQLVESLAAEWEPTKYEDSYRDELVSLLQRKANGEDVITAAEPVEAGGEVVDLMAALEASVKGRRDAKGRHPSGDSATESTAKAPAKKAPAKKAPAKKAPAKAKATAPAKKRAAATTRKSA